MHMIDGVFYPVVKSYGTKYLFAKSLFKYDDNFLSVNGYKVMYNWSHMNSCGDLFIVISEDIEGMYVIYPRIREKDGKIMLGQDKSLDDDRFLHLECECPIKETCEKNCDSAQKLRKIYQETFNELKGSDGCLYQIYHQSRAGFRNEVPMYLLNKLDYPGHIYEYPLSN
jgi:hypothetical protein